MPRECQQCVSLPFVNPGNLLIVLAKSSVGGTKQSVPPSAVSRLAVLQVGGLPVTLLSVADLSLVSVCPGNKWSECQTDGERVGWVEVER